MLFATSKDEFRPEDNVEILQIALVLPRSVHDHERGLGRDPHVRRRLVVQAVASRQRRHVRAVADGIQRKGRIARRRQHKIDIVGVEDRTGSLKTPVRLLRRATVCLFEIRMDAGGR